MVCAFMNRYSWNKNLFFYTLLWCSILLMEIRQCTKNCMFYMLCIITMNKIFKKTLAVLACAVLIGQTMITGVVSASEEIADSKLKSEVSESLSAQDGITSVNDVAKSVDDVEVLTPSENKLSDDVKIIEWSTEKEIIDIRACDDATERAAMNLLKEAVNEEILSKNIKGIKATVEGHKLVLIVDTKDENQDLIPYVNSLIDLLLGNDGVSFWSKLNQKWFNFNISSLTQLIDVKLGLELNENKIFDLNVIFNDCELDFQLEFRVKTSDKICDKGTTRIALDAMKDIINDELSSKSITGIVATVEGSKLVLTLNNEKDVTDLTSYKESLINFLLGNDDASIWTELEENGFVLDIWDLTQLIDVNLELDSKNVFDLVTTYDDCELIFQMEFRTNNTSTQICDTDTIKDAMNIMKNAVDEEILAKSVTGIKASVEGNKLVLIVNTDKENQDLTPYVNSLIDLLLGNDGDSIWSKLNKKGFDFNISSVTQLIDVNLGLGLNENKIFDLNVMFKDCELDFLLEFRTNDISSQVCDTDSTNHAMDILKTAIDEEISNNKISGVKTSIENNILVLTFDKWKEIHDLTPYINSLINHLLWSETNSIWSKLSEKWFLFDISDVTQLIDVNLSLGSKNSFDLNTTLTDCILKFKLEFRVDNSSNGNNWSSSGWWNGYSGWGGSSSGWWSSSSSKWDDEDLSFWWEVSDLEKACSIEWSTYSDEINEAYIWACKKWIVAADNIMDANLTNPITRAELDKMLSVYAIKLLWMNHVIEEWVTYPDVNDSLGDLAYYIQEWYKLQIMWIHANGTPLSKFLPHSLVTRWEFWTVFSRILYGNEYNVDGANYYVKHLDLLKNAGILKNTNPKLTELRGRILLMLYRSQNVKESNWSLTLEDIAAIAAEKL